MTLRNVFLCVFVLTLVSTLTVTPKSGKPTERPHSSTLLS